MSPKEILRGKIKERLKALPPEDFTSGGEKAAIRLRASPFWSRYSTIFLFLSINREIDTLPLLETSLLDGKKVFAPGVEADTGPKNGLVFYRILSPDGPWTRGPFGIREPADRRPAEAGDFPALILCPGLAFDAGGNRLGKGGGYYDRFFSELDAMERQYLALGLCMDFQLAGKVPAEENDKKVNGILTEKRLISVCP